MMFELNESELGALANVKAIGFGIEGRRAVNLLIEREIQGVDCVEMPESLKGADIVFIIASADGAKEAAVCASDLDVLTVALMLDEGAKAATFDDLRNNVDTFIHLMSDEIEKGIDAIESVVDLISVPGEVSLDFTDVKSILQGAGEALVLIGKASGDDAINDAIDAAIISPIADIKLRGAQRILLSIKSASQGMSMMTVNEASMTIQEAVHPDAEILWGVSIDNELGDTVKAIVIATRFSASAIDESDEVFSSDGTETPIKHVFTDKAPAAVGPYSQAIEANGIVWLSGQIAIDPSVGVIVATDIEGQADQCCRNVMAVLAEAGVDIKSVVKTTCFLTDITDFAKFNAVYEKYFVGRPARSCVAVKALPAGALCEIEVIGVK